MISFDEKTNILHGEKVPPRFPVELHISELISINLRKTPNRVVQIYEENGSELTCDALRLSAIRIAQNLAKLGIRDGDVIGFVCSNSENLFALVIGCIFLGAVANPIELEHGKDENTAMWGATRPKFVFCDADVYDKVRLVLDGLENHASICTLMDRKAGVLFVDDILAPTGYEEDYQSIKCDKPYEKLIGLFGSSGTSGPIKAVSVTQYTPIQFVDIFYSDGTENARVIHCSSISWMVPHAVYVAVSLTNMTRIVTRRTASIEIYFELIEKFKAELIFLRPLMLNEFIRSPSTKSADLSSLKSVTVLGSITYPNQKKEFSSIFPDKRISSIYGTTEVISSWSRKTDVNDGYKAGRIKPNGQIKIVDDDGKALDAGEHGEICVKSIFPFVVCFSSSTIPKDKKHDYLLNRDTTRIRKQPKMLSMTTAFSKQAILDSSILMVFCI